MRYISVDLETTGLDPLKDDILEFGAVFDDLEHPKPYDKLPQFHSYVLPWRVDQQLFGHLNPSAQGQHASYHGDPYALSMHPTILRRIAKREAPYVYRTPQGLIQAFSQWLNDFGLSTAVFCGKNFASFDLQFLNKIPNWYMIDRSFRSFDPTALYIKVGEDTTPPSTAKCLARAGLDKYVPHTAIEDAINVIKLVRHGLLVSEPADFEPKEKSPAPFADTPLKTAGCHVVVGVKGGKPTPIVLPAKKAAYSTHYCKEAICSEQSVANSIYCEKHHNALVNKVVRNSPLAKHYG